MSAAIQFKDSHLVEELVSSVPTIRKNASTEDHFRACLGLSLDSSNQSDVEWFGIKKQLKSIMMAEFADFKTMNIVWEFGKGEKKKTKLSFGFADALTRFEKFFKDDKMVKVKNAVWVQMYKADLIVLWEAAAEVGLLEDLHAHPRASKIAHRCVRLMQKTIYTPALIKALFGKPEVSRSLFEDPPAVCLYLGNSDVQKFIR